MAYAVGHVSGGHFNPAVTLGLWSAGRCANRHVIPYISLGKYGLLACFCTEVLMTFFFLFTIIGTTSKGAATGFAGIPIGLALTLIHLVSLPVTKTSVNPARRMYEGEAIVDTIVVEERRVS